MPIQRNHRDQTKFNPKAVLPFELRLNDFAMAMQDVYNFFHDVNVGFVEKGLERVDDMLRPAITSGPRVQITPPQAAGHFGSMSAKKPEI